MTWLIIAILVLVVLVAAGRRLGIPDGQPAGPAPRPLRPVLAGARRCAGAARGGGACRRDRRLRRGLQAPEGRRLAALADAAERAPRPARENAENELSAALAMVDPASLPAGLIAELADAEARVVLARRFHNDAVRDTLALAERRLVRAFRLGGTAALPSYFEIVERPHALAHGDMSLNGFEGVPNHRTSARVVLLDETGAVLLLCGSDPANPAFHDGAAPRWWFTVGGEVRRRRAAGRGRRAGAGRRNRPAGRAGRHDRTHLAARRGLRVQRLADRQRGVLPRPPHSPVRAVPRGTDRAGTPLHPRCPLV